MQHPILIALLAGLIGIVLGALGTGGGILALPVLLYVAELPLREAVAVSQVVIALSSLFGTLLQGQRANLAWRHILCYGLAGVPLAKLGNYLGNRLEGDWQMVLFGALVGVAGYRILRGSAATEAGHWNLPLAILSGAGIGFLTGLLGVGGGFLLVPVLISAGGLAVKLAAATSLPIIALNAGMGAWDNRAVWQAHASLVGLFLGSTLVGTYVGIAAAHRLSEQVMRKGVGWALVVVGIFEIIVNAMKWIGR
ncbi:MAG: sulfite exporter TauE/SafE family protein [Bryobacter sp.]